MTLIWDENKIINRKDRLIYRREREEISLGSLRIL